MKVVSFASNFLLSGRCKVLSVFGFEGIRNNVKYVIKGKGKETF
jgi:hypothetical protein